MTWYPSSRSTKRFPQPIFVLVRRSDQQPNDSLPTVWGELWRVFMKARKSSADLQWNSAAPSKGISFIAPDSTSGDIMALCLASWWNYSGVSGTSIPKQLKSIQVCKQNPFCVRTYLDITNKVDPSARDRHAQVSVHALPMVVKECVRVMRLLVKKYHNAEVSLLVWPTSECELRESIVVCQVVLARKLGCHGWVVVWYAFVAGAKPEMGP